VDELVAERQRVLGGLEVAVGLAPRVDGVGDAGDHLLDRALAVGGAQRAAEVLLHDDVGRGLRPRLGELDLALLEVHLAVGAADDGVAQLPLDLGERIHALAGEEALDGEARAGVTDDAAGGALGALGSAGVLAVIVGHGGGVLVQHGPSG
jgi:hypothetical protein